MNDVIGSRIRYYRKKRGLSQKFVADQLGISLSYMSQLENGKNNITVTMLVDIARILNLPSISTLMEEDPEDDVIVVTPEDRKNYPRNPGNVTIDMLFASRNRQLEASIVHLPAGSDTNSPQVHQGDEFCYVVRGRVLLILADRGDYPLDTGAVVCYPAHVPHSWKNIGEEDAEILIACTPVSF